MRRRPRQHFDFTAPIAPIEPAGEPHATLPTQPARRAHDPHLPPPKTLRHHAHQHLHDVARGAELDERRAFG